MVSLLVWFWCTRGSDVTVMADVDGINISPVNPAVGTVVRSVEKKQICFKRFFFPGLLNHFK